MKCALLSSGGKDGWLAMWYATNSGLEIRAVLTFIPERSDSFMFHGINSKLVKQQAKLAGLKHIQVPSSGEKGKEQDELVFAFRKLRSKGFRAVVSGAIESEYQRERVERACSETDLSHFAPLWHKSQQQLLWELTDSGEDAVIVSAAADGMGKEWLGRKISECKEDLLRLQKYRSISPMGEGGEFETFAFKSPLFKSEMQIGKTRVLWKGGSGSLEILSVRA